MDVFDSETRSRVMRQVKSRDTRPEMRVRRMLHAMGCRYRLHRRDLPGAPDIVMPGRRRIIFVHGCFWHGHDCKAGRKRPATHRDYWDAKLRRNRLRDAENLAKLEAMGWRVLIVWECETRDAEALASRLRDFLTD